MLNFKLAKAIIVSSFILFVTACVMSYHTPKTAEVPNDLHDDSVISMLPDQKILLNRHALLFTSDYLKSNTECLLKIKQRSTAPFRMIDKVFRRYSLPVELKYLAVIESELKPTALSPVGAAGPWQLMPETGRALGLNVSDSCDERKQYSKSTRAAALYLKDLYAQFDDWLLVIAAYNCGPGPVCHAIHKSGSRNFWNLQNYLPAESRDHVKKFIATHYYFEGRGSVTTSTKAENAEYLRVREMLTSKLNRNLTEKHAAELAGYAISIDKHTGNTF